MPPRLAAIPAREDDGAQDDTLMGQVARGSEDALEALVARHRGRVVRYGLRVLGDFGRAEDLAQETFLRVFRHAAAYEGRGQFASWLLTIASRLSRNTLRSLRRRPEAPLRAVEECAAPATPHAALELRELGAALRRLPERQRNALMLKAVHGFSYREIAGRLGCSAQDVANAVFRARKALAHRISR